MPSPLSSFHDIQLLEAQMQHTLAWKSQRASFCQAEHVIKIRPTHDLENAAADPFQSRKVCGVLIDQVSNYV